MSYKNNEGYPAPTEGEAIRRASRMPTHVYNDYCLLNNIAGRLGLEVAVIRERKQEKNGHRGGENNVGSISVFWHGVRNRSPGVSLDRK